eukprot:1343639-Pleurochrysis_carterae.AAC.9
MTTLRNTVVKHTSTAQTLADGGLPKAARGRAVLLPALGRTARAPWNSGGRRHVERAPPNAR